jgi:hypothetical protein
MPSPSPADLPAARAKLLGLATASKPPRILDVLRQLRQELLLCQQAGHSASTILAALRAAGFPYSRSGFAEAWKAFRDENGLTLPKPVVFRPSGTLTRRQAASTPEDRKVPRPEVFTATQSPPPGSALAALSRPSISELLNPKNS